MSVEAEALLEPILRRLRFQAGKKYFNGRKNIFDFGCGPHYGLYKYLIDQRIPFQSYVGFDPLIRKSLKEKKCKIENEISKVNGKFDLVTMFAVLEHVPYPDFDFSFLKKITIPGSIVVLTTPTKLAKKILEFLSYKIGIVSRREIEEHQHYYTREEILAKFQNIGFELVDYELFEFGANSLCVLRRI